MRPTEKLSEVQKMLQFRILSRQKMKEQKQHFQQNNKDILSGTNNNRRIVATNLFHSPYTKQSGEKNLTRIKSQEKKLSQNLSARKRIRKPGKKLLSFKLNLFKFHLKCFHGV